VLIYCDILVLKGYVNRLFLPTWVSGFYKASFLTCRWTGLQMQCEFVKMDYCTRWTRTTMFLRGWQSWQKCS